MGDMSRSQIELVDVVNILGMPKHNGESSCQVDSRSLRLWASESTPGDFRCRQNFAMMRRCGSRWPRKPLSLFWRQTLRL